MWAQGHGYIKRGIAVGKDHKPGLPAIRQMKRRAHDTLLRVVPDAVDKRSYAIGAGQHGELTDLIQHRRLVLL
jgi:hypothetical protein